MRVEFTVEPFVEGQPGRHVTAAIAAAEALGVSVDFGPFGSSFDVDERDVGGVVAAVVAAAVTHGASHVTLDVSATAPAPAVAAEAVDIGDGSDRP